MDGQLKAGTILTSESSNKYKVVTLLGAGGQGEVYDVESNGKHYALKWYFKHMATSDQKRILDNLIAKGSPDSSFLWPQDMIYTSSLEPFGYIMPLRPKNFKSIVDLMKRRADTKVAQTICNEWKNRILKIHRMLKRDFPVDENGEKDEKAVLRQYGTTLIGLMICDEFLFAFQIGDGDIVHVDDNSVEPLIQGEHILGVETHSLSRDKAWEKAFTVVRRIDTIQYPCAFMLSTDGFANSYPTAEAFQNTCGEYYQMLKEHGPEAIQANLSDWLDETSRLGCGDDITWLCTLLEESEEDKDDINVGDE